ncbi:NAD(P)/FAD-dependent oxidoreductase [Phyllobacterium sp. YR531]|uniref:FAD-dependent oxidoreductase n=1 Tax=Phyllobacterium sp. YR531 TaxID=1144343 RepID=UPI00026F7590|nr:NAD(P)/FAD-dependent oxidoreductase [Phyllobacterium sp. YR531]EJN02076.1 2-polyprenyl-6-methoxyphenol hydroxylase-like oxidoreductase [Phyllobacterium sp. YR531]
MTAIDGSGIAVCGAGIAGLVLAIRLRELGYSPTVFEERTSESVQEEGEFLTLAPNGMNGLRAIDCYDDVLDVGIDTMGIELLNARGKSLIIADQSDHAQLFGAPSITLRRGKLTAILLKKVDACGIPIRFGCRVSNVENGADGATVQFENGDVFHATWVVAADGLRSAVRQSVFPEYPVPRFTGVIGTGGVVDANVPSTGGLMRMTFGRQAFFGYIKDNAGPVHWFNSYFAEQAGNGRQTNPEKFAAFIRGLHTGDPAPNALILEHVGRIDRSYPIFDMPVLPRWWKDRVILIGDAAHAVGPHAGQGASMAIEDSIVLAACLNNKTELKHTFRQFENLRRDRINRVVEITARNRSQKGPTTWLGHLVRDLILPIFVRMGIRQGRKLFSYRVDIHPLSKAMF